MGNNNVTYTLTETVTKDDVDQPTVSITPAKSGSLASLLQKSFTLAPLATSGAIALPAGAVYVSVFANGGFDLVYDARAALTIRELPDNPDISGGDKIGVVMPATGITSITVTSKDADNATDFDVTVLA